MNLQVTQSTSFGWWSLRSSSSHTCNTVGVTVHMHLIGLLLELLRVSRRGRLGAGASAGAGAGPGKDPSWFLFSGISVCWCLEEEEDAAGAEHALV